MTRIVVTWLLASSLAAVFVEAAPPTPARVLLLAQKPDGHPPGTHEYLPGLKLLESLLRRHEGITTQVESADEPWSEGVARLREADAAVMFLSQGAAWTSADARRLDALSALAARKGGLVTIHWGMGVKDAAPIDAYLQLFGGCHGGPDRRFQVVDASVRLVEPRHPTAFGIAPLDVHEEFYYRLKFVKSSRPVTPVVQVTIDGQPETVAWAWERPDGGRSFGFSGLHFHDNWRRPEYRRLVTQAVLWTLGREIPASGVNVDLSADEARLLDIPAAAGK